MAINKNQILNSIAALRAQLVTDLTNLEAQPGAPAGDITAAQSLQSELDSTLATAADDVSQSTSDADALQTWTDWFEAATVSPPPPDTGNLPAFAQIISNDVPGPANQLGQCTYPVSGGGSDTACMTSAECSTLVGSHFSPGGC